MGGGAANVFEIVVNCFIHSTLCHQRNTTKQGEHNQSGFWTTHSCDLSVIWWWVTVLKTNKDSLLRWSLKRPPPLKVVLKWDWKKEFLPGILQSLEKGNVCPALPWVPEGLSYLIPASSRRSRDIEARSTKRKKSPCRELYQTVSTVQVFRDRTSGARVALHRSWTERGL